MGATLLVLGGRQLLARRRMGTAEARHTREQEASEGPRAFREFLAVVTEQRRLDPSLPIEVIMAGAMRSYPQQAESLRDMAKYLAAQGTDYGRIALLEGRREEFVAWVGQHYSTLAEALRAAGPALRTVDDVLRVIDRFLGTPTVTPTPGAGEKPVQALYQPLDDGLLGSGAEASVRKARRLSDNSLVALREPLGASPLQGQRDKLLAQWKEEVRLWEQVSRHPNVVRLIESGTNPHPWIAMELMAEDLRSFLHRKDWPRGQPPVSQSLQWAISLCDALGYAHRAGIIHRDIKPENVLFTNEGVAKLSDWGAARHFLGLSSGLKGSLPYAAPEQLPPSGEIDQQSDVFQMGVVLYELFAGRYPWTADGAHPLDFTFMDRIKDPAYAPPLPSRWRTLPPGLDAVIMRAVAKPKPDRYYTGNHLRDELTKVAEGRA